MKKYKLIQWYPSLPKDFKIGSEVTYYEVLEGYSDSNFEMSSTVEIETEEVENNSNFWEKVIPKEYEILSILDCNNIHKILPNGDFKYGISTISSAFIPEYPIHSVRRLSDDEVFTIGDKVRIKKLNHDGSFNISEFYFDCNNDKLLCNGKRTGNGHVSITKIEKVKIPLFTTIDGVDIYKDNDFFSVVIPNLDGSGYKEWTILNGKDLAYHTHKFLRHFSTKEKAENYILMNKPCLSINDIVLNTNISSDGSWCDIFRQLVKNKL